MQISLPVGAPTLFKQKLSDLPRCTDLNELKQLHALIYKSNLHRDLFVAPKLITALSLCRQMGSVLKVFDQIPNPNVHLCNTLIKAHIRNSEPQKAFEVFYQMQDLRIVPDKHTYVLLLKSHTGMRFVKIIHAYVEKFNLYSDLCVPNSLIVAYSKYGLMGVEAAKSLFDAMKEKDIFTNTSMITGLVMAGQLKEAKQLFDEMPQRNIVSWNAILHGYVKAGEMTTAFKVFENMPSRDVVSWSTVISGYARTGDIEMAEVLFDKMPEKNLVTWTIMISSYAERGLAKDALFLYDQMEKQNLKLNDSTFLSILSASAKSRLLSLGKRIHKTIIRSRYNSSTSINNALINMYCKCGSLNEAQICFNEMERKDLVSWNTMIHGLAMHGHEKEALHLFESMRLERVTPNPVTFIGVLSACNHAGLLDDGIRYFYSMESNYNITPQIKHYGCMIDLLGRGGRLNEAFRLLNCMPFEPDIVIWCSLLGACRMHNAVELAEEVHQQLVKLDPIKARKYSTLPNVYAAAGDWENAGMQD